MKYKLSDFVGIQEVATYLRELADDIEESERTGTVTGKAVNALAVESDQQSFSSERSQDDIEEASAGGYLFVRVGLLLAEEQDGEWHWTDEHTDLWVDRD